MKKFLLSILFLLVLFSCVACEDANSIQDKVEESSKEELRVLKSDLKLTQEQSLSRIKAEYLVKNKGYSDDDEITVLIELKDESLLDIYNKGTGYLNLAQYAISNEGVSYTDSMLSKQKALIQRLQTNGYIQSVNFQYTTVLNAISVTTTYGTLSQIEKVSGVEKVVYSDTYNLPKTQSSTVGSAVENAVNVYDTGIYDTSDVTYTGKNTAVAILDSGFDCSHSVFQSIPAVEDQMISKSEIADVLSQTKANRLTKNLQLSDVYYSGKIPFVYDYADHDPDVFPYDSEHGTHVAGIIGGQDDTITGVAVDTQLVLMKVFPDLDTGAGSDAILAALEDAILLGVDAINMSLGSSCGFTREVDEEEINRVYDAIGVSGISLITAASNSYSAGYGGAQGNTNMVTNPDSGTVGSPSTYQAALSVASISGTKSKYIIGNDSQVIFFNESNAITGDQNDFFKELGLQEGEEKTYEYITIPGVGLNVNYLSISKQVKGKIALIRRGTNTFEEKAQLAKKYGAIGCIIYNNIDGDILMSMGKSDHIPTISISKDAGTILASKATGTLKISYTQQAGPFMSDFSSWGPTPSLELKPEITAHGGNIKSSVPGGGYDELSGTSMASPNLCGIVVLIRQYLKEKYPDKDWKEISVIANELLMSTATIALNEEGNPYSPRKQGAGLASLSKAVNALSYLTVDGKDRTKLELFDDPTRTGVYNMDFNIVNTSNKDVTYTPSILAMTESVSTSDSKHVAEKADMLNNACEFMVGNQKVSTITVKAGETVKVHATYKLTEAEKKMIDEEFPYGMYVEGFVTLTSSEDVDLSVPFLAFYGDWSEAPMFDKTFYEVESEAHDASIDEEDKIKADYYATTPYGSYYHNYMIPLGSYLYDIDTNYYDPIPASEEHIAISNYLGTLDGISAIYAGLLRGAKQMNYTVTDVLTGEVMYEYVDYNCIKSYSYGGSPIPYYQYIKMQSTQVGLVNNRQYEFTMTGLLDYKNNGADTNIRNSYSFKFYLDDEAPIIKNCEYEKIYDSIAKKDRYYVTMTVYDNHYVQSITPLVLTSSTTSALLSENPVPVYGERNSNTTVRFEITDYLANLYANSMINNALIFSVEDYALNSNIYICELPGTRGDFKFTKNGQQNGEDLTYLTVNPGEVVDVTKYLTSTDITLDEEKEYLKYLTWTSSNDEIVSVSEGMVVGLKPGKVATITATELLNGKKATLTIRVNKTAAEVSGNILQSEVKPTELRFAYFVTKFAYSRSAQTSEIGSTGDTKYITSSKAISFYPGESIQLFYDMEPSYALLNYKDKVHFASMDESIAKVDENGVVTGLKEGSTTIVLKVDGSNLMASVLVNIKNEFVIENRMLVAYKGLGGDVVIPDDEGIMYIGAYAFCLYDTDYSIILSDEDYDANKIPQANTSITSITIPNGVSEIQKYAFYNCSGLKSVNILGKVDFIREYAFYNNKNLETINLDKVHTIGKNAFYGCEKLNNIDLTNTYAIGVGAFEGCSSLEFVDLTALRNTGDKAFKDCTNLKEVVFGPYTKLSTRMMVNTGIETLDLYEELLIPTFAFAKCKNLTSVTLHNPLVTIGEGAFTQCENLSTFVMEDTVREISSQAFFSDTALISFTLPNNKVSLGDYVFYQCSNLDTIVLQENTEIENMRASIFKDTKLANITLESGNSTYTVENGLLVLNSSKEIVLAPIVLDKDLTIGASVSKISDGAFSGSDIETLTILSTDIEIGAYAFNNCTKLTKISFVENANVVIGAQAFRYTSALTEISNSIAMKSIEEYAFANTGLSNITLRDGLTTGEGIFFSSSLEKATIGKDSTFGLGAFQSCAKLTTVTMPEEGNVHFGKYCFAYDIQLSDIDLSKHDAIIEEGTFLGCSYLKNANLANVTIVKDLAFADCSALAYVNVPVVEFIGEDAFGRYDTENGNGAPVMTSITLPESLTHLGAGAFLGCSGLLEVTIPSNITEILDYTFSFCVNLDTVELPESVKSIGTYAFAGCELLKYINLENVEYFKDFSFSTCPSLENVDLSSVVEVGGAAFSATPITGHQVCNSLVKVDQYGFQGSNLLSIDAPKLSYIGKSAFQNNSKMESFTISNELSFIDSYAFLGCSKLTEFKALESNQFTNTCQINDYAFIKDGILYTVLTNGKYQLQSIPAGWNQEEIQVLENTVRVDEYAGNENENIQKIVLPDSLRLIGNYAFYNFSKLKTVEFKSVMAPALEDSYDSKAELSEADDKYAQLHPFFDLYGFELCYFNFVGMLGKTKNIHMILPANEKIEGYDSLPYEGYFGKVTEAERSSYEAMEKSMILFMQYATELMKFPVINLNQEVLVDNTLSAYNSIKQDYHSYNIEENRWNEMVEFATNAKKTIRAIKLNNASDDLKNIQIEIDALNTSFEITSLDYLRDLSERINALSAENRSILDLTKYNTLFNNYQDYCNSIKSETRMVKNASSRILVASTAAVSVLGLAAYALKLKKWF